MVFLSASNPTGAEPDPIALTAYGSVRGVRTEGCLVFKGIPYAASTAGEGRFMPPQPPPAWPGVRAADRFGPIAPQSNPAPPAGPPRIILAKLRPAGAPPPPRQPESEDCLFLNVWTAGLDQRKRPVIVRLHGGFFAAGSGAMVDGSGLASRGDVVVVSVNHRLNVLGFTYLADIAGAEFAHSGNAGMQDIIAALIWIRDNIEQFGGDPRRVMVCGESGGGMKTGFLLSSPPAVPMIATAGVESGPSLRFMERDAASAVSERLLAKLELPVRRAADLKMVPVERLLAAYFSVMAELPKANFSEQYGFGPVIDPELLPHQPFSPDALPLSDRIPVIFGWNRQDMSFFLGDDPGAFNLDAAGLEQRLRPYFGAHTAEAIDVFGRTMPRATPTEIYLDAWSDYSTGAETVLEAERKTERAQARAWLYRFDWRSPALNGVLGATHTLEVPFILNVTDRAGPLIGSEKTAKGLAARVSDSWAAFASSGDPNTGVHGLPYWPAYSDVERATMIIDTEPRVERVPEPALRALQRKVRAG